MAEPAVQSIEAFIARWQGSGAAERANYQLFLSELCDVLGVARPEPKTAYEERNAYVFEKSVPLPHGTTGGIDLYRRGCFVLEAKQGSDRPEDGQSFSERALRQRQGRKRSTAMEGKGVAVGAGLCAQFALGQNRLY